MNNLEKIYQKTGLDALAFSKAYADYLITLIGQLDHSKIADCIGILEEARQKDNTIFVIGNGGSASTASHIGNDFGLAVLILHNRSLKPIQSYVNFHIIIRYLLCKYIF